MFCKNCGKEIREGSAFCPNCGTPVAQNEFNRFTVPVQVQKQSGLSMVWYQFVTTLGLWLSAIVYAVLTIRTLLGSAYIEQIVNLVRKAGGGPGDIAEIKSEFSAFVIWRYAPVIGIIDVIAIICYIVLIVMAVKIRTQLIQYQSNAPQQLNHFIVIGAFVYFGHSLLRQIAVSIIRLVNAPGSFSFMPLAIIGLIGAFIVVFLNNVYFTNRKHLFMH